MTVREAIAWLKRQPAYYTMNPITVHVEAPPSTEQPEQLELPFLPEAARFHGERIAARRRDNSYS